MGVRGRWGLGKAPCEALETVSFNRGQGAVVLLAALPNSEATKLDNGSGVHPRTPEIILAEREALQPRASAEDRVVARGARNGR